MLKRMLEKLDTMKPEIRMLYQPNCDYHLNNLAFDLSSFCKKRENRNSYKKRKF